MSTTVTSRTLEDWFFLLAPLFTGAGATAILNITQFLPGVPGLVVGIIFGALAKTFAGIAQEPKSLEDWIAFLVTFLGALAAAMAQNVQLAEYGVFIGFVAKALPSLAQGINVEDILLTLGALISLVGMGFGPGQGNYISASVSISMISIGSLLSILGKTVPSLVTNGAAGNPPAPTPAPATPAAGA